MSAAQPGQIVAGAASVGAIGGLDGVEAVPLGPLAVKVKREPVEAWVVQRAVS